MSVQIMKRKLEETRDGLQEVEVDEVLARAQLGHKVTAIVTYEVIEHRDNADGSSTLVKAVHIEPLTGDLVVSAQGLQQQAYQVRTGNETLGIFDAEQVPADDEDPDVSLDDALVIPFGGDQ
jgi:ABC-type antimicrobial peptide transport system ATPase subunit